MTEKNIQINATRWMVIFIVIFAIPLVQTPRRFYDYVSIRRMNQALSGGGIIRSRWTCKTFISRLTGIFCSIKSNVRKENSSNPVEANCQKSSEASSSSSELSDDFSNTAKYGLFYLHRINNHRDPIFGKETNCQQEIQKNLLQHIIL